LYINTKPLNILFLLQLNCGQFRSKFSQLETSEALQQVWKLSHHVEAI